MHYLKQVGREPVHVFEKKALVAIAYKYSNDEIDVHSDLVIDELYLAGKLPIVLAEKTSPYRRYLVLFNNECLNKFQARKGKKIKIEHFAFMVGELKQVQKQLFDGNGRVGIHVLISNH